MLLGRDGYGGHMLFADVWGQGTVLWLTCPAKEAMAGRGREAALRRPWLLA